MDLDDIPPDKRYDFPTGVSEVEYRTVAEMTAFIDGFVYAASRDADVGMPFERDGRQVVRVRVGDWGDD